MARVQTIVQLNEELLAAVDEAAGREGLSRSALIREAITEHLRELERDPVGEAIAEGYRRLPQATSDAWGDPSRLSDRHVAETLARLEAEEQAAGQEPW